MYFFNFAASLTKQCSRFVLYGTLDGVHVPCCRLTTASTANHTFVLLIPSSNTGMSELVKERPANPIEFLASYLLQHDPQRVTAPGGGGAGPSSSGN